MDNEIIYSNIQTKADTLLVCGGGTCNAVPRDLCTLTPSNTCNSQWNIAGDACPEVNEAMVGSDFDYTYVIVCCDSIGNVFGFSSSFLSENGVSQYNGTSNGDCIQLMNTYAPVEGDYCDRLNAPNYTFPPSCGA